MANEIEMGKKLDASVVLVFGQQKIKGFEKAYVVSDAIGKLRAMLTEEYMKPIMNLQGSKLGFRTDKDKNKDGSKGPGYPMEVVRDCLIDAVLIGLQPTGNEFNIISGQMYPTKEGCGALLARNFSEVKYSIITGLPRVNNEKTSCAFELEISWEVNGEKFMEKVPKPIKIDSWTSVDAMVGKAERKGRAWLISRLSGVEITDGETEDANAEVLSTSKVPKSEEEEENRVISFIHKAKSQNDLDGIKAMTKDNPSQKIKDEIAKKEQEFKK